MLVPISKKNYCDIFVQNLQELMCYSAEEKLNAAQNVLSVKGKSNTHS